MCKEERNACKDRGFNLFGSVESAEIASTIITEWLDEHFTEISEKRDNDYHEIVKKQNQALSALEKKVRKLEERSFQQGDKVKAVIKRLDKAEKDSVKLLKFRQETKQEKKHFAKKLKVCRTKTKQLEGIIKLICSQTGYFNPSDNLKTIYRELSKYYKTNQFLKGTRTDKSLLSLND